VIGPELATVLVTTFLAARYKALERYERRLGKVRRFDEGDGAAR
jgi:ribose 5-phosphate isomerase RpiB